MITERLPQPGGLGWQPGMGPKWAQYRAGDVVTPELSTDIRYWNASGWWGDQGQTSQCTIYAWLHVEHDGPITHRQAPKPLDDPTRLYQLGQDIDGTPHGDVDSGLTSDAAARVMLAQGYIGEYRWARNLDEVVTCIANAGPGTLGTWWPEGMDTPDRNGFGTYTGRMLGGHQFKVDGVNTHRQFFRCKNSWGRGWAKRGFFYLTFATMKTILAEGGEFCIARELLDRTVPV